MKVNDVGRRGVKESERTRKKGEGSLVVKHVNIRKKSLLSHIHPHPPAHAICPRMCVSMRQGMKEGKKFSIDAGEVV